MKKQWWMWAVFGVLFVGMLVATLVYNLRGGDHPDLHDEARFGVVALHWTHSDWPTYDQQRLQRALAEANRLGPTHRLTEDPYPATAWVGNVHHVRLVRGDWASSQQGTTVQQQCRANGAGRYTVDSIRNIDTIAFDPVCCNGDMPFQATVVHELGHAQGMRHLRHDIGEVCSDCGEGVGVAVMNQGNEYGSFNIPTDSNGNTQIAETPWSQSTVTTLDATEARAALARGRPDGGVVR